MFPRHLHLLENIILCCCICAWIVYSIYNLQLCYFLSEPPVTSLLTGFVPGISGIHEAKFWKSRNKSFGFCPVTSTKIISKQSNATAKSTKKIRSKGVLTDLRTKNAESWLLFVFPLRPLRLLCVLCGKNIFSNYTNRIFHQDSINNNDPNRRATIVVSCLMQFISAYNL